MPAELKHYRIEIHTADPNGYELVETLAKGIRSALDNRALLVCIPTLTPGYGAYVAAEQFNGDWRFPIIGNECSVIITEPTVDELAVIATMTVAKLRRNYWLCQTQLSMCSEDQPRLDKAAERLQIWQASYLNELVARGARI